MRSSRPVGSRPPRPRARGGIEPGRKSTERTQEGKNEPHPSPTPREDFDFATTRAVRALRRRRAGCRPADRGCGVVGSTRLSNSLRVPIDRICHSALPCPAPPIGLGGLPPTGRPTVPTHLHLPPRHRHASARRGRRHMALEFGTHSLRYGAGGRRVEAGGPELFALRCTIQDVST